MCFSLSWFAMGVGNSSVLVLSVETVAAAQCYGDLSPYEQQLWCEKNAHLCTTDDDDAEMHYMERAAVQAEFGRVITIGVGFLRIRASEGESLRIHILQAPDERSILADFLALLPKWDPQTARYSLCAHNGREFDFPFLCRRLLSQGFALSPPLQLQGKKAWELPYLQDTFEMWKFGDRKRFTSLRLLCQSLGIAVDKVLVEHTGGNIHTMYYQDKDMTTIACYAGAQVKATAAAYLRLQGLSPLQAENISMENTKIYEES